MTSNTWTSSKEASRWVKAQDATAGDLLEWTRQGKLRARADHVSGLLAEADKTDLAQLSELRA